MPDPNILIGGATLLGGLLGGGGGQKPTYGYSYGEGTSFGQGGSASRSMGQTVQRPDFVWPAQTPYLQNMYQWAQNQAQSGVGQQQAGELFSRASEGFNQLLQPGLNPLMEVYQRQMQQGLEQNILPAIRREAIGYNALGGARQGVAEGMAAQQLLREQGDFAARLYGQDMDRMLGAITQAPGMIQTGLGIPWYGLNQMAGILGRPVVLGGGGYSVSESTGSSFQVSGSEDFSESFTGPKGYVQPRAPGRPTSPTVAGGGGFSSSDFREYRGSNK